LLKSSWRGPTSGMKHAVQIRKVWKNLIALDIGGCVCKKTFFVLVKKESLPYFLMNNSSLRREPGPHRWGESSDHRISPSNRSSWVHILLGHRKPHRNVKLNSLKTATFVTLKKINSKWPQKRLHACTYLKNWPSFWINLWSLRDFLLLVFHLTSAQMFIILNTFKVKKPWLTQKTVSDIFVLNGTYIAYSFLLNSFLVLYLKNFRI
jgi:hypothetical protein